MTENASDQKLLLRYVQAGDEAALATLVTRHLDLVYGAACRYLNGDVALAQDAAQTVFLTLVRRAAWLTGHPSLAGWLHQTAVHSAGTLARSEARRRQREETAFQLGTTMNPDEAPAAWLPELDEVLLELDERDRQALVLRYFENQPLKALGMALGCREDAAQKRVAKALQRLSDRLQRRGIRVGSSAAAGALLTKATAAVQTPSSLLAPIMAQVTTMSAGAAAHGSVAIAISHLMAMTKLQTATLVLALAAVPVAFEAHGIVREERLASAAQSHWVELAGRLQSVEAEQLAWLRESRRMRASRTEWESASSARKSVARLRGSAEGSGLYLWDPGASHVRLPRSVLTNLAIRATSPGPTGVGAGDEEVPAINPEGSVSSAILEVLGLTPAESADVDEFCRRFVDGHASDAARRSRFLTTIPGELSRWRSYLGDGLRLRITDALDPAEVESRRRQFADGLSARVGPERFPGLLAQLEGEMARQCDGFGGDTTLLALTPGKGPLTLADSAGDGHRLVRWRRRGATYAFDAELPAFLRKSPHLIAALLVGPEVPVTAPDTNESSPHQSPRSPTPSQP